MRSWLITLGALALAALAVGAPAVVGGRCQYNECLGTATIVRVVQTAAAKRQVDEAGFAGCEVWFTFVPKGALPTLAADADRHEHEWRLANGWWPGARYVAKYDLRAGKTLPCKLLTIRTGTCTPVLFELIGVDGADYCDLPAAGKAL